MSESVGLYNSTHSETDAESSPGGLMSTSLITTLSADAAYAGAKIPAKRNTENTKTRFTFIINS